MSANDGYGQMQQAGGFGPVQNTAAGAATTVILDRAAGGLARRGLDGALEELLIEGILFSSPADATFILISVAPGAGQGSDIAGQTLLSQVNIAAAGSPTLVLDGWRIAVPPGHGISVTHTGAGPKTMALKVYDKSGRTVNA